MDANSGWASHIRHSEERIVVPVWHGCGYIFIKTLDAVDVDNVAMAACGDTSGWNYREKFSGESTAIVLMSLLMDLDEWWMR